MAKPTPRPWRLYSRRQRTTTPFHEIQDSDGVAIVKWGGFDGCDQIRQVVAANADLIVRAVNAHDALLEALREAAEAFKGSHPASINGQRLARFKRVIALAEPEPQPPAPEPIDGPIHEPGEERS